MHRFAALLAITLMGCGSDAEHHTGTATMEGDIGAVDGLAAVVLTSEHGVSIARSYPPTTEIKVAADGLACDATQAGDRITFDLGAQQVGTYEVVKGYPSKTTLSATEARAHICPKRPNGQEQPPCYDMILWGQVAVTKFEGPNGRIEGTYSLTVAENTAALSGTFSAYRCN